MNTNNFYHYIDSNNELYIYGSNREYAIGRENRNDYITFSNKIWICDNVKKVNRGLSHTAILTNNGDLYLFGDNRRHQIGLPSEYVSVPYKIRSGVFDILCTDDSTVYINYDNTIGEYGNLRDLQYSDTTTNIISQRLTPFERYNFVAVGENIRILGIYNIYDSEQKFIIDGNYEDYNQPHYTLVDFLNRFKATSIQKIIISNKQLFVLESTGCLYYYGKYSSKLRCTNSGTKINEKVKDIVLSRDKDILYIVKEQPNKFNTIIHNIIMSHNIIREDYKC